MALGLIQPLTETGTRNHSWGKGQLAHKADLTIICEPIVQKNVGAFMSHNPIDRYGFLLG
jgi:hypothetical protein